MSFLYVHFYSEDRDGFLGNVSITLIHTTYFKLRKEQRRTALQTQVSLGLNIESFI